MKNRVLFVIGARGSAYELNCNCIKSYMQVFGYSFTVCSCYDIESVDTSNFDIIWALAWMDARVERVVRNFEGIKCATVGSHVHIEREMHGMLQHYNFVFSVSDRIRNQLESLGYGSTLINYFYPEDVFFPAEGYPKKFTVGWVGNFNRDEKRYEIFRKAVKGLDVDVKVSFLNSKHTDDGRIEVVPDISYKDMGSFYRGLSCYIVCSKTEGQPKTGVEAMLCGLPVVSSDVGLMKELNALIIPEPLTVESVRLAIRRLAGSPDAAKQVGNDSLKTAKFRFDDRRILSEWKGIFEFITRE